MRVRSCRVGNLSRDLFLQMYSLNLRDTGLMRDALVSAKQSRPNAWTFYLKDGDKVLGWAIIHRAWYNINANLACFYVRRSHRKRGLAQRLARKMLQKTDFITIQIHDDNATALFEKLQSQHPGRVFYTE